MQKINYKKRSYMHEGLKHGIAQIKMVTEKFNYNGDERILEIETSTYQSYYHISYSGFNREEFERTKGIHGRYHGYHFKDNNGDNFTSFEQVQKFIMETYGFRLRKEGETIKHHYI